MDHCTSRSTVPLFCASANRYVSPTSSRNRSPGNPPVISPSPGTPRMISSMLRPTAKVPTRKAASKASAPRFTGMRRGDHEHQNQHDDREDLGSTSALPQRRATALHASGFPVGYPH